MNRTCNVVDLHVGTTIACCDALVCELLLSLTRWLHLRFDFDSTAIRPRYDYSTTYVTTVGLPVCGPVRCGLNR